MAREEEEEGPEYARLHESSQSPTNGSDDTSPSYKYVIDQELTHTILSASACNIGVILFTAGLVLLCPLLSAVLCLTAPWIALLFLTLGALCLAISCAIYVDQTFFESKMCGFFDTHWNTLVGIDPTPPASLT